MLRSHILCTLTLAAGFLVFAATAEAKTIADARLVAPTESTTYRIQCDHARNFSRLIVTTPNGKPLAKHTRRNGDTIWRDPRGGHVKWSFDRTIINHAHHRVLFVAFCA